MKQLCRNFCLGQIKPRPRQYSGWMTRSELIMWKEMLMPDNSRVTCKSSINLKWVVQSKLQALSIRPFSTHIFLLQAVNSNQKLQNWCDLMRQSASHPLQCSSVISWNDLVFGSVPTNLWIPKTSKNTTANSGCKVVLLALNPIHLDNTSWNFGLYND